MLPRLKLLRGVVDIKPFDSAGINSRVFTGTLRGKEIIFTINKANLQQRRQKVWLKPLLVQKLLKGREIPFPKIYRSGFEKGYSVVVQQKLPGKNAGNRTLQQKFKDICKNKSIHNKLLILLKKMHKIKLRKYGYLESLNGGMFSSWNSFLISQINYSFTYLAKTSNYFTLSKIHKNLMLSLVKTINYTDKPRLLHGDMINYTNVLVKNSKITGIIDFEWSLAGDPAYDFAFDTGLDINNYNRSIDFKRRQQIYCLIWLLWGCTVHPNNAVGKALYSELKRRLAKEHNFIKPN